MDSDENLTHEKFKDDKLIKLINIGLLPVDCAIKFGVPLRDIWKRIEKLEEQGIMLRDKFAFNAKKFEDEELIPLITEGLSDTKCAARLGVSRTAVSYRRMKLERQGKLLLNKASNIKYENDELIQTLHEEPRSTLHESADRIGVSHFAVGNSSEKHEIQGKTPCQLPPETSTSENNLLTHMSYEDPEITKQECSARLETEDNNLIRKLHEEPKSTLHKYADQSGVSHFSVGNSSEKPEIQGRIPPETSTLENNLLTHKSYEDPEITKQECSETEDNNLIQVLHEEPKSTLHKYADQPGVSHFSVGNSSEKHKIQGRIPRRLPPEILTVEQDLLYYLLCAFPNITEEECSVKLRTSVDHIRKLFQELKNKGFLSRLPHAIPSTSTLEPTTK